MSHIQNKKPAQFGPLNSRKSDHTVGQTYGERREKATPSTSDSTQSLFQKIRDRFQGAKKPGPIEQFSNKDDRYEGANAATAKSVVDRKNRLELGQHLQARVVHPPKDRYVGFLDSVIHFFDKKTPKKV